MFVLSHSGIPNMSWGIRRFQNKDGTYTELGKQRKRLSNRAAAKKNKGEKKKAESKKSEAPTIKSPKKKNLSSMSDSELQFGIDRMTLEKKYTDLYTYLNPEKKSRAKELISDLAIDTVKKVYNASLDRMLGKGKGNNGGNNGGGKGKNNNRTPEEDELKRIEARIGILKAKDRLKKEEDRTRAEQKRQKAERRSRKEEERRRRRNRDFNSEEEELQFETEQERRRKQSERDRYWY